MPGHMGDVTRTVEGLVVLYIDPKTNEVWVNGPVPGSYNSIVRIRKTNQTRKIDLDREASGLPEETPEVKETQETETQEIETQETETKKTQEAGTKQAPNARETLESKEKAKA